MGKRGKSQVKGDKNPKKKFNNKDKIVDEDMDDEIDAFHKQRDLVSLDVNKDMEDSDDDDELPVFDFEDGDEDKDESDEDEDDIRDTGFAAKMAKQQKYLREKFGGVEDDMHGDDDEEDDEQKAVWGGRKDLYYDADNVDFEIRSSDDESPAEEEAEVIRLQKENAKSMSMADFGLEDTSEDESDRELTLEEISVKGKTTKKKSILKTKGAENLGAEFEEVKKDLSALSKEELMDVLFSSAPELVGLLSELNDATDQLENKVDPLLNKVKNREIMLEGGIRYLELKKLLLLSYCQAIAFYLLLKSEGQPVRDHPVLARLVEVRSLLDKTKQLDGNLPADLEEILNKSNVVKSVVKLGKENGSLASASFVKDHVRSLATTDIQETAEPNKKADSVKVDLIKDSEKKSEKRKRQDEQVGLESMKMLKVRADLEEKLKQKGVFSSSTPKIDKAQKLQKPLNRKLETYDDFDDDTGNAQMAARGLTSGHASSLSSSKFSQLLAAGNKSKVVSGDDDLPERDDIGERRRKHEVNVLNRAGIGAEDDVGDEIGAVETDGDGDETDEEGASEDGSEDEFYNQVKEQRAAKLAAKAQIYSRDSTLPVPSLPEIVDGKRHISYQIQKNRGLTRQRNKKLKNPRKKYKEKHKKAVERRKGQVRDVKTPKGRYPGETSGINAAISRSVRLKS